jgi:serine/threonine-protein kinase RsbW
MKTLTVPATLDSLSAIGQFVLELAAEANLNKLVAYRARLAVDEIATNAVMYGQASESGQGVFEAHGVVSDQTLTITLEDAGTPFDPRQVAPPADIDLPLEERGIGGLGIHLALTGVDHYSYERIGNRNRSVFIVNRVAEPTTADMSAKKESRA